MTYAQHVAKLLAGADLEEASAILTETMQVFKAERQAGNRAGMIDADNAVELACQAVDRLIAAR